MTRPDIVYIDPPSFSDGADGEELMANHPGDPFTDLRSLTSSTFVHSCGELLYELRYGTTHGSAFLSRLPDGYSLTKSKKQNCVYGHPSRRKYGNLRGFKAHLRWLELRSQNKMVHCKCDQCILDNAPQTNDKEYIQGSQKIAHTSHQLHWDEVLKAQKIILTKKHQFPPLMQKPKKKKPDHGSLNDIKLFSVQVPDVLPNPKSDYLLMKNINKINKNKNKNPAPDE